MNHRLGLAHIFGILLWGIASSAIAMEKFYTITSYDEAGGFFTGHERRYTETPNGLREVKAHTKFADRKECGVGGFGNMISSLFKNDELFSLAEIEARGYRTAAEVEAYSSRAKVLLPEQVKFFHIHQNITPEEYAKLSPREKKLFEHLSDKRYSVVMQANADGISLDRLDVEAVRKTFQDAYAKPIHDYREAALYMVRGQTPDPYLTKRLLKVTWQHDPVFAHAADFSRIDYPLTFEIGRAAQMRKGQVKELLKLATTEMAEEARIYGVPSNKVSVFIHAKGESHIALYQQELGAPVFTRSKDDPLNVILEIKLSELEKFYPSEKTLESVQSLVKGMNGALKPEHAIALYRKMQDEIFQLLDRKPSDYVQNQPLLLVNELFEIGGFLSEDLIRAGVLDHGPKTNLFFKHLNEGSFQRVKNPSFPEGIIADPSLNLEFRNAPQKSLRIQNVDPEMLKTNPDYLKDVLLGVRNYYHTKIVNLQKVVGPRAGFPPERLYSIVSTHSDVVAAAKKLGAIEMKQRSMATGYKAMPANPGMYNMTVDIPVGEVSYLFFTEAQLTQIARTNPEIVKRSQGVYSLGKWQQKLNLISPILR